MKEGVLWIGYHRPEYTKVSLESILTAHNSPIEDFHAYVDFDGGTDRNKEIIQLLEEFKVKNVTYRPHNFGASPHILRSIQDFFSKGYDICHFFQDDTILSKSYFNKCKEVLTREEIIVFCGCIVEEHQRNAVNTHFSTWGSSFKKSLYDKLEPYIEPFIDSIHKGTSVQYQIDTFGRGLGQEFDALIDTIVLGNNMLCLYPERSYAKDIGEYGFNRVIGIPPVKTLQEWAIEPPKGPFGYGINGMDFDLE